MVYYIYKEKSGYWCWRLIDGKGMTIVNSEQRYPGEEECSAAVKLIKASGPAPVCVLGRRSRTAPDITDSLLSAEKTSGAATAARSLHLH